ncbi:MAG: NAD(P)H-hydrate dehydratase [Treponema sp.]|nr:NAD(P)H-hydrate dehydratase [Treponema sp.]
MEALFLDTRILDKACREKFLLSEDCMMENAAAGLEDAVMEALAGRSSAHVLILCGSGNNGADGYALARRIVSSKISVSVAICGEPKSELCKIQKSRAENTPVEFLSLEKSLTYIEENSHEINLIVDCIFGSGFHGSLPDEIFMLIEKVNSLEAFRISCDIPSGLDMLGNFSGTVFRADLTVTMGALKLALVSDNAKDCTGEIQLVNLGVQRELFESCVPDDERENKFFLLTENDLRFPFRNRQNVNKGSFGHAVFIGGEKIGAGVIASSAALRLGAGLVSLVDFKNQNRCGDKITLGENGEWKEDGIIPYEIMCTKEMPENTKCVALGMGLGRDAEISSCEKWMETHPEIPVVFDADIFYNKSFERILKKRSDEKSSTVLTPHPKEFSVLLENCGLGKYSVAEILRDKISLVGKICTSFPNVILLLKGATVLIAQKKSGEKTQMFFNPHGTNALSKAGSGDVLDGLIASLLAQGYETLDAVKSASLIHAFASQRITPDFSMTPFSLMHAIQAISFL